jgi:sulfate adenylyltransferase
LTSLASEIGVKAVKFKEVVYLPDEDRYEERGRVKPGRRIYSLSGTEVRDRLLTSEEPFPAWYTRPEVAEILTQSYPARRKQGCCIWLTGLSGAGKSTVAEILTVLLMECGRQITLLDGDVVRTHLSKGLGFTREDRDANILRIGFVAAEVTRHGGIVVVAAISPYEETRHGVRNLVGSDKFVLVYVDTPLAVCEQRDRKGLYAKARRGEIKGVTGIDDHYEIPANPEIVLDMISSSPEDCARQVMQYLVGKGLVPGTEDNLERLSGKAI